MAIVGLAKNHRYRSIDSLYAVGSGHESPFFLLWVNRLIGDPHPDAAKKYTFADVAPYKACHFDRPTGAEKPL